MATLPTEFKFARAEVINRINTTTTESQSLIMIKRRVPGQRWEFDVETIPYQVNRIRELIAFLNGIADNLDTITTTLPVLSKSDCPNKTTSAAASVGARSVTLTNASGVNVGDFFNFSSHGKAYQVTGVSGSTMSFMPGLKTSVSGGETVTFNGCTFTCHLQNAPIQLALTNSGFSTIQFDMVEAI